RQVGARNIVDTLRLVLDSQESVAAVLAVMNMLAMDCDQTVRAELVDQLPSIASFCAAEGGLLEGVVRDHVVPTIVQYLTDVANQVRKRTQISLLFILERALIERKQLEEQICRPVVHLTQPDMDDYKTEAVTLMTKMAPYLGKDTTVDLFLPAFVSLCQDASFHVRKATNFGDFCSIVGQECTEDNLVVFHYLCEDSAWAVRKACAEVFMPVSCVCSLTTRRNSLAPLFMTLLDDQSRWVRLAAFQALGPFISTFADPSRTGLYCSEDGVVSVRQAGSCSGCMEGGPANCPEGEEVQAQHSLCARQIAVEPRVEENGTDHTEEVGGNEEECQEAVGQAGSEGDEVLSPFLTADAPLGKDEPTVPADHVSVQGHRQHLVVHVDGTTGGENRFNTFQFWRTPIPEVRAFAQLRWLASSVALESEQEPLRFGCIECRPDARELLFCLRTARTSCRRWQTRCTREACTRCGQSSTNGQGRLWAGVRKVRVNELKEASTALLSKSTNSSLDSCFVGLWPQMHVTESIKCFFCLPEELRRIEICAKEEGEDDGVSVQDIVPVELLERYRTMTDPVMVENLDSELGRHCAHSLPAVALTLGRHFWPCLRHTYNCLALDVQWKVRVIVASCLHELARILGPQIASQDLVPCFEGFVRDVDEVRGGLLERLGAFLRGLRRADQRRSLPLLGEFLSTDNHRNWRFRFALARQIKDIAELYNATDINQYLVPIVLQLLEDKVAEVRRMSVKAVVVLLQRLESHYQLYKLLIQELAVKAHMTKWSQRQLYCELAEEMVHEECLSPKLFAALVLPHLLGLHDDRVPNVRMALARCLTRGVLHRAFFLTENNPYKGKLEEVLLSLQRDGDRDVRHCAQLSGQAPN
ncbi:protein phosphatase 2A regulatory subunit A, putative, partial [Ixodes scapularis]